MTKDIVYNEDCLEGLKKLPDSCIDCCVTSPPYYGLRDYGNADQLGLEETPELYVEKMVAVFEQVRRVLKKEGTLWLNLGDSYAGSGKGGNPEESKWKGFMGNNEREKSAMPSFEVSKSKRETKRYGGGNLPAMDGVKPKDLFGIPWMVAFALRSAGWYLRQDIIWHKPNPMPESVTDRCTKAHEYIFLLSKSAKYYYDADAIKKPFVDPDRTNYTPGSRSNGINPDRNDNDFAARTKAKAYAHRGTGDKKLTGHSGNFDAEGNLIGDGLANKKSVWTVTTRPYSEAHFATFPERLIVDCIKAGCPEGGIVLDPFIGAFTTSLVAKKLGRHYIGYELNGEYIKIGEKRMNKELGMFR